MSEITGKTAKQAQKALKQELEKLFEGKKYSGQQNRKGLTIYEQDLPIDNSDDEDADTDAAKAPYIIVKMTAGEIISPTEPQYMDAVLIICCYDDSGNRQGYEDVAIIKEDIIEHFCAVPFFGGSYTVLLDREHRLKWAMQEDDTHPYYYGAVQLAITCPAVTTDATFGRLV